MFDSLGIKDSTELALRILSIVSPLVGLPPHLDWTLSPRTLDSPTRLHITAAWPMEDTSTKRQIVLSVLKTDFSYTLQLKDFQFSPTLGWMDKTIVCLELSTCAILETP